VTEPQGLHRVLETLRESERSDKFEQALNGLFSTQLENHDELIP